MSHSSVLVWRIPGIGEPGGLPSMRSHKVGHGWNDLAAARFFVGYFFYYSFSFHFKWKYDIYLCYIVCTISNWTYFLVIFFLLFKKSYRCSVEKLIQFNPRRIQLNQNVVKYGNNLNTYTKYFHLKSSS